MNKKAQSGEAILMIVRLVLLTIIAFAVYFISSLYLNYHLDIRPAESSILSAQITECIAPNMRIELSSKLEDIDERILSYCGFSGGQNSYIFINITENDGKEIKFFEENQINRESGAIYGVTKKEQDPIERYRPGSFIMKTPITLIENGNSRSGIIKVGVNILHNE
jgi:hypothetical protein